MALEKFNSELNSALKSRSKGDSKIESKRVSILGCGWLGYQLALRLVASSIVVRGSTTSEVKLERLFNQGIIPHKIKVSDKLIGDIDSFFDCDILIVNIPPGRGNPSVVKEHPQQIRIILDHARAYNVSHLIFTSSIGVYKNSNGITNESGILGPVRPSGKALLIAEESVRKFQKTWTILRLAGLCGGDRQPGNWFSGKVNIPGGNTPVNMVHREDCIAAILKIIEQPGKSDVYNICADEHPLKKNFYKIQSRKIGVVEPIFVDDVIPHKIIDNRKFKQEYHFEYSFPDPCLF